MSELRHKILAAVKNDLADIETELRENLHPHSDLLARVAGHILFSGGKRLRPLLAVLCARLCAYAGDYDKVFSTVFEYLHAATLLHDDLVDDAEIRRGKPVAHSIWGPSVAVLAGDFLLARSLSIASRTERPEIINVIAGITESMSQGEIEQLARKGDILLSEAEYMEIIACKTAVMIQGACRSGAMLADADPEAQAALATYGLNLGTAFQMIDDLLDYTSDTATLGKEIGTDLKEGKLTLPLIHALKTAEPEDRTRMEEIIRKEDFSLGEFETLKAMLTRYEGLSYTRETAVAHIRNAKESLSMFGCSQTREILLNIADYALERKV